MKENKFWFDNMKCLFYEHHIYPSKRMSLESKMNAMTRLIILIFLILLFSEVFNMKNNIIFLILSLFIIIILYYKEKNNQMIENYEHPVIGVEVGGNGYRKREQKSSNVGGYNTLKNTPERTCSSTARINYRCEKHDNENITKIVYNQNKYNPQNDYNSRGYNPNFNKPTDNQFLAGGPNPKTLVPPVIPVRAMDIDYWREKDNLTISTINSKKERYNDESGYITSIVPTDYSYPKNYDCKSKRYKKYKPIPQDEEKQKENFDFPYEIKSKNNFLNNEDSLYYKDFKNNPYFETKYNENVFKETITPGNYRLNTRNEPINSNIGISLPQTFEDDNSEIIEPFENVNMSNVYDPRFYGYGTSYRQYFDKNVGQPRFYYDDINAVKMPNYITRNHIDVTPFGDSYGAMDNEGNKHTSNIHQLADRHYNESMMQFRDEMQNRLMRKVNSEQWQQRMYPIHKHSQR